MRTSTFPTIIRNSRDDDFETAGRLDAAAVASDAMIQLLTSEVSPNDMLQWAWIDGAKASVAKGDLTVLVLERTDTQEMIGIASYTTFNRARQPQPSKDFPKGYNVADYNNKELPAITWARSLTEKYGEVLFLTGFAIAPSYQAQGFGKALMVRVIEHAQEQGLNIGLTALSGKPSFYAKVGFKEVSPPVMLANGTIEGPNMMLLELFKPSSHA